MDEHDKRAREVEEDETLHLPPVQLGERLVPISQLHAAVAAERERCAKLVEQYGGESDFCPNGCSMGYLADVLRSEADALEGT